jgi:hypothetical protein
VTADRRYLGVVAKFLGFLLGVAVALAGPAVFGVLAAPGGIELNAKELALAFGIGALVFWAVVSYFSGAGALGAFVAFGTLVYCWLWIPNRTTNFLNDVPGVTTGMIDGSKQYTTNGVVPILGVISLVYAIQLIVRSVQRRRRQRAEDERLQREQEAEQAQQEADVAAVYPVAGSTYAETPAYENHTRYDDLFDEPEPVQPRNQADDQTRQFPVGSGDEFEQTRQFPEADARGNYPGEEMVAAPMQEEPVAQEPPAVESKPVEETQAMPVAQTEPVAQDGSATQTEPEVQSHPVTETETTPVAQAGPVAPTEPVVQAQSVAQAEPVEETQAMPAAEAQATPAAETESVEVKTPEAKAEDAKPVDETRAMPVAQGEPVEAKAPEGKAAETTPIEETRPVAQPELQQAQPAQIKAQQAQAEETKPPQSQAEQPKAAEKDLAPKEQVGSQYRERMENPEDTGEFYLAFENPVVKPA